MKTKRGKSRATRSKAAKTKGAKSRRIVLPNQELMRRTLVSECSKELARLEKARAEWTIFQDDKLAFNQWMNAQFGPLLSQVWKAEALLREQTALLCRIHGGN